MWKKPHNWLIAAAALLVMVMLSLTLCHAVNPETGQHYSVKFTERIIYIVFIVLSFIISDIALLAAAKPFNQVFYCIMNSIILLSFQAWIFVEFFTTRLQSGLRMSSVYTLSIGAVFPLVAIVLLLLAVKFAADEGTAQRIARAFEKKGKEIKR